RIKIIMDKGKKKLAGFNTRGLQNIGFSYAMQPGLEAIYDDHAELVKARKRYRRPVSGPIAG
ncbi:hypothetical protein ADUPG1_002760, partial [Aduncisulcus paluster]